MTRRASGNDINSQFVYPVVTNQLAVNHQLTRLSKNSPKSYIKKSLKVLFFHTITLTTYKLGIQSVLVLPAYSSISYPFNYTSPE